MRTLLTELRSGEQPLTDLDRDIRASMGEADMLQALLVSSFVSEPKCKHIIAKFAFYSYSLKVSPYRSPHSSKTQRVHTSKCPSIFLFFLWRLWVGMPL